MKNPPMDRPRAWLSGSPLRSSEDSRRAPAAWICTRLVVESTEMSHQSFPGHRPRPGGLRRPVTRCRTVARHETGRRPYRHDAGSSVFKRFHWASVRSWRLAAFRVRIRPPVFSGDCAHLPRCTGGRPHFHQVRRPAPMTFTTRPRGRDMTQDTSEPDMDGQVDWIIFDRS